MSVFETSNHPHSAVPQIPRRSLGLFGSFVGVILTLRPQSRGSPPVPNWLRRDIGLPPADESRSFWDYR